MVVVAWVGISISILGAFSFSLMFCSGARLSVVLRLGSLTFLFHEPAYIGERIAVMWGRKECILMPLVMESTFCNGIGKLISYHTSLTLNFIKVNGSVWFAGHGDDSCQSLTCACILSNSRNKSCFRIWDRGQAISEKVWQTVLPCLWYCLLQLLQFSYRRLYLSEV